MLSVGNFPAGPVAQYTSVASQDQSVPLLSIILLCRLPHDEAAFKALVEGFALHQADVELIVMVDPWLSSSCSRFSLWPPCCQVQSGDIN